MPFFRNLARSPLPGRLDVVASRHGRRPIGNTTLGDELLVARAWGFAGNSPALQHEHAVRVLANTLWPAPNVQPSCPGTSSGPLASLWGGRGPRCPVRRVHPDTRRSDGPPVHAGRTRHPISTDTCGDARRAMRQSRAFAIIVLQKHGASTEQNYTRRL